MSFPTATVFNRSRRRQETRFSPASRSGIVDWWDTWLLSVLVAHSDRFENPLADPWAKLVDFVRKQRDDSHILASSSSFGKNAFPCVAALLDVSPVTDVVKILGSSQFIRNVN